MEKVITSTQYVISGIGAFIGWFVGGFDGVVSFLFLMMAIDILTGSIIAFLEKKISSKVGFKGISKKVVILCLVGVGNAIDVYIFKSGNSIRMAVTLFYIYNEGISILENTAILGLPVPQKLKDALEQVGNHDKREGEH